MPIDYFDYLQHPRFSALDFSDCTDLTESERVSVRECMNHAMSYFIACTSIRHTTESPDGQLRQLLQTWAKDDLKPVCSCSGKKFTAILDEAAAVVEYFFPCAELETRITVARATAAMISADDAANASDAADELAKFQYNVWLEQADSNGWSKLYKDLIKNYVQYFGANDPRIATLGATGWAWYVEALTFEQMFSKDQAPRLASKAAAASPDECSPCSLPYLMRATSGAPLPFIAAIFKPSPDAEVSLDYWIASIPSFITYINQLNDLFSLPKEVDAGETGNYMSLETTAKRQAGVESRFSTDKAWTFRDTICQTMNQVHEAQLALDKTFAEVPWREKKEDWQIASASECWIGFRDGYASWHMNRPRYGFQEVSSEMTV